MLKKSKRERLSKLLYGDYKPLENVTLNKGESMIMDYLYRNYVKIQSFESFLIDYIRDFTGIPKKRLKALLKSLEEVGLIFSYEEKGMGKPLLVYRLSSRGLEYVKNQTKI